MATRNEGIVISGRGSLTADQVAVGRNAHAEKIVSGPEGEQAMRDLQAKIEALLLVLKEHQAKIPQAHEAMDAATTVAQEVAGGKPNKLTVAALLDGIATRAKSVSEVVSTVSAVKALFAAFL